jgi:hypothetical protein
LLIPHDVAPIITMMPTTHVAHGPWSVDSTPLRILIPGKRLPDLAGKPQSHSIVQ